MHPCSSSANIQQLECEQPELRTQYAGTVQSLLRGVWLVATYKEQLWFCIANLMWDLMSCITVG